MSVHKVWQVRKFSRVWEEIDDQIWPVVKVNHCIKLCPCFCNTYHSLDTHLKSKRWLFWPEWLPQRNKSNSLFPSCNSLTTNSNSFLEYSWKSRENTEEMLITVTCTYVVFGSHLTWLSDIQQTSLTFLHYVHVPVLDFIHFQYMYIQSELDCLYPTQSKLGQVLFTSPRKSGRMKDKEVNLPCS